MKYILFTLLIFLLSIQQAFSQDEVKEMIVGEWVLSGVMEKPELLYDYSLPIIDVLADSILIVEIDDDTVYTIKSVKSSRFGYTDTTYFQYEVVNAYAVDNRSGLILLREKVKNRARRKNRYKKYISFQIKKVNHSTLILLGFQHNEASAFNKFIRIKYVFRRIEDPALTNELDFEGTWFANTISTKPFSQDTIVFTKDSTEVNMGTQTTGAELKLALSDDLRSEKYTLSTWQNYSVMAFGDYTKGSWTLSKSRDKLIIFSKNAETLTFAFTLKDDLLILIRE